MVIGVAHFPEHVAVPVGLQHHAALEWKTAEKILLGTASVKKEGSALGDVAGQPGRVRERPSVDDRTLEIDEIDVLAADKMRRKQRKSRKRVFRVVGAQTNASAFNGILLDGRNGALLLELKHVRT